MSTENTTTIEQQTPAAVRSDWFGWFYRPTEPGHVISLCAGHKYLAGRGWKPGQGSLEPLPPASLCCVCYGTATIRRMRGAPLHQPNDETQQGRSQQQRVMPLAEPKVSSMGMWMDNSFEPGKFILVDCGYVNHQRARDNAERLLRAMGVKKGTKGYVEVVGFNRVLVRVPHTKKETIKRFKNIREGAGYSWTTHTYEKDGPQFALKHAA